MSTEFIGVLSGIVLGLILCIIIFRVCNKDNRLKSEYDERQLIARGKAYKAGFYTVVGYLACLTLFFMSEIAIPFTTPVLAFFGIALGVSVVAGYSIWKGAYWGLNNNRTRYAVVFVICAIINLGAGITAIVNGYALLGFQGPIINLICGIMLLVIGIASLVKNLINPEKDADEEDE